MRLPKNAPRGNGKTMLGKTLACALAFSSSISFAAPGRGGDETQRPLPHGVPKPGQINNNFPTQPRLGRYVEHLDQWQLVQLSEGTSTTRGRGFSAFSIAREKGDNFFDNLFEADALFGAGANVGQGQRFTRVPRADLKGPGEWASHFPARATGPNAASCIECHTMVRHDGSGFAALNAIRDPLHSGDPSKFVNRNTPHLFGGGALQLLAEEMTGELHKILTEAKSECQGKDAQASGKPVIRRLVAKGVEFGKIIVKRKTKSIGASECQVITKHVEGIDSDLVVKPFQWKGSVAFLRDFNRGAAHNEDGQQSVELVGEGIDGDGDGVVDEVTVGDLTAVTVYTADQPRPVTKMELADMGVIPPLSKGEIESIHRGRKLFDEVGCASCHTPRLKLKSAVYSEPSQSPFFRDAVFPAGQDPASMGLDPSKAIRFDLTKQVVNGLPFDKGKDGMIHVDLYGDLKRHDLGPENAESIDEAGTGASWWMTENLWGVGSTPPYMHDGRASTISQAVESHGGEAAESRKKFRHLSKKHQEDVVTFLMNLRLWKLVDIDS